MGGACKPAMPATSRLRSAKSAAILPTIPAALRGLATGLVEAIDFAAKHPELQLQFPIVALGSFALDAYGYRHVAALYRDDDGRALVGDWFGSGWRADCRFLFVRKTSSR